jgi:hypothetical protein
MQARLKALGLVALPAASGAAGCFVRGGHAFIWLVV